VTTSRTFHVHRLNRVRRPFGHRIAYLLGYALVEDAEVRIARLLVDHIFSCESRVGSLLNGSGLDTLLFAEMAACLDEILDGEEVRFDDRPLMDMRRLFAGSLYFHFQQLFRGEEAQRTRKWVALAGNIANALDGLTRDVLAWLRRDESTRSNSRKDLMASSTKR
jgi:hypothetical protein